MNTPREEMERRLLEAGPIRFHKPGRVIGYKCSANTGPHVNGLVITEVKISLRNDHTLKAVISMVLNDCFAVTRMKLIEGDRGLFLAMPNRRHENKNPDTQVETPNYHQDLAYPICREMREYVTDVVLAEYWRKAGPE